LAARNRMETRLLLTINRGNKDVAYQEQEKQDSFSPGIGGTRILPTRNRETRLLLTRNRGNKDPATQEQRKQDSFSPEIGRTRILPTRNRGNKTPSH
jgi:hypothetical protein